MKIKSAKFIKGVVGTDSLLENNISQVAFIGRSNVGKSSTINALTNNSGLARTSSFPGRTQEINIFLINLDVSVGTGDSFYLIDLPGYGYAKAPVALREKILKLTKWYLVDSGYKQKKVVLIIDAYVGPTSNDLEMLRILEKENKNVIVIANKVDKLRSSDKIKQLKKIQMTFPNYKVIPFSAEKKIGLDKLVKEIMS